MSLSPPLSARALFLGNKPYEETWRLQLELVGQRQRGEIPDTLLLVEHPHVVTLGRGTHRENLLSLGDMPTFEIERGGDVTYHGPGQLVGYPIVQLGDGERDLHAYLRNLETALMLTVESFGVPAARKDGFTGAWTRDTPQRKLASIGIAVKKWVTLHGFALNVATDLARFQAINPCGLAATAMTSLAAETTRALSVADVLVPVTQQLGQALNRDFGAPRHS